MVGRSCQSETLLSLLCAVCSVFRLLLPSLVLPPPVLSSPLARIVLRRAHQMPPALGNRFEVESKAAEGCNRQENLAVSGWGSGYPAGSCGCVRASDLRHTAGEFRVRGEGGGRHVVQAGVRHAHVGRKPDKRPTVPMSQPMQSKTKAADSEESRSILPARGRCRPG